LSEKLPGVLMNSSNSSVQYFQLLDRLLLCPNGKEAEILRQSGIADRQFRKFCIYTAANDAELVSFLNHVALMI
jgi:hypothetical protein